MKSPSPLSLLGTKNLHSAIATFPRFSAIDPTMGFIEKIFSGKYVGKNLELNGIVQLFNTFNVRNQNLQDAVNKIGIASNLLFSYGVEKYFHDKPTYFGFSNEVLNNEVLREVAMNIFNNSSEVIKRL